MKKLFKINGDEYVVADNYENAIRLWLTYYDKSLYMDQSYIKSVELVTDKVIVWEE